MIKGNKQYNKYSITQLMKIMKAMKNLILLMVSAIAIMFFAALMISSQKDNKYRRIIHPLALPGSDLVSRDSSTKFPLDEVHAGQISNSVLVEGARFPATSNVISSSSIYSENYLRALQQDNHKYTITTSHSDTIWEQIGNDIFGDVWFGRTGRSVVISGDGKRVLVVTEPPYFDLNHTCTFGYAQVYEALQVDVDGTSWVQVGSNIITSEYEYSRLYTRMSSDLSADGKRVIVGNPWEIVVDTISAGYARVFEEKDGLWIQVGNDLVGEAAGDRAGYSVGISADGKRVVIDAPYHYSNGIGAGQTKIYEEKDGAWLIVGEGISGDVQTDENFVSRSISLSGDGKRVAVADLFTDPETDSTSYSARVYQDVDEGWVQVGYDLYDDIYEVSANMLFSRSSCHVEISENGKRVILAVNDEGCIEYCHVKVYEIQDDAWVKVGSDLDFLDTSDIWWNGYSVGVSADGKNVIVGGVTGEYIPFVNVTGHAKVFQDVNGTWVQIGSDLTSLVAGDRAGYSVGISRNGETVVVGAPENDERRENSGHARIFVQGPLQHSEAPSPSPEEFSSSFAEYRISTNYGYSIILSALSLYMSIVSFL